MELLGKNRGPIMRSANRPSQNRSTSFVPNQIWRPPLQKCESWWWNFAVRTHLSRI